MSSSKKSDTASGQKTTKQAETPLTEIREKQAAQGFRGVEIDPTPNENYTVAGVTSGKPTPETDVNAAKEARKVTGLAKSGVERAHDERSGNTNAANKGAK